MILNVQSVEKYNFLKESKLWYEPHLACNISSLEISILNQKVFF